MNISSLLLCIVLIPLPSALGFILTRVLPFYIIDLIARVAVWSWMAAVVVLFALGVWGAIDFIASRKMK